MECLEMMYVTHNGGPTKKNPNRPYTVSQTHLVPCGKCAFCLQKKRDAWCFRIYHEMITQEHKGHFLTFTYDEKHVPRTDSGALSLRFYDIQLYFKRLRKEGYYCKYICVGEYGSQTERPHYHMLLWTDAPTEFLESNWKSSKDGSRMGSIHFGQLNEASAMYSLKYILQPKQTYHGREKPRAQFSRGLGIKYMTWQIWDWHCKDHLNLKDYSYIAGEKRVLPRYYRTYMFNKHGAEIVRKKHIEEQKKKKDELYRKLESQGFSDPAAYERRLRSEIALRIIKKTKFNQHL